MQRLFFLCALALMAHHLVYSLELNSSPLDPERCEIWGRVIAPSSVLERGLQLEFVGEASARRQKVPLLDGSFQFSAVPSGLYHFRILDRFGQTILTRTKQLKGEGDYVLLRFPLETTEPKAASMISVEGLRSQIPSKAVRAFRDGEKAATCGDVSKSIGYFEEALALYPRFPKAEANLAVSYIAIGQDDLALQHAQRAYELDPDFPDAAQIFATLLQHARRYLEAEAVVRCILRTYDKTSEFHALLAVSIIGHGGNIDEALEHLKLAAVDFPMARLLVANILVETNHQSLALSQVKEYIRSAASQCERPQLENWVAQTTKNAASAPQPEATH